MPSDKEIKKEFKAIASKNPDQYYATNVLRAEGFSRKQCTCGTFFWSAVDAVTCGDPACSGGFRFIGKSPAKRKLDYIGVWSAFAEMFKKRGYTPIPRYPVAARWRTDTDFVQASIYDFQPYVVSGEVAPPANPLVVPQFCLRFNDIDNVGITGAHYTGFVMIGQHAFMPPEHWDQATYFRDIHAWLTKGLGLPLKEITYHEDAWAGGGNFGPCMEFFSRGLELGNQVYMLFEQTTAGPRELPLKVLDMGMGHERNAWFTQGTSTSYETTFPTVCRKLFARTGVRPESDLMKKFLPYASYLNVDEVEDIGKTWEMVAQKIGIDASVLKRKIGDLAALYSVAEHSRTLLVALSDGALPANVGGGYNLRAILRRALRFIDQYEWNLSLPEICEWHAEYLRPLFPELSKRLDNVQRILDVEKQKYANTKQMVKSRVQELLSHGKQIPTAVLLQEYDSKGIPPELIAEEAQKQGITIAVPDNFYGQVAARHEQRTQEHQTAKDEKLPLDDLPETPGKYFADYRVLRFKAKVLRILQDKYVVLHETFFFPTSGGQLHDTGQLEGIRVIDVFKQGKHIVHTVAEKPKFREGDIVEGIIDQERRIQLSQHHTATHIMNAAARNVLGPHSNQAGAKKTPEYASIDLTHFESLTEPQLKAIEEEANRIVVQQVPIETCFMPRNEAEERFTMDIYQGGVAPGKLVRIVNIQNVDVEACGGTHLKNTGETGRILVQKSTKISDGIVRIFYVAGKAAEQHLREAGTISQDLMKILGGSLHQLPGRADELFRKWKTVVKKGKEIETSALQSTAETSGSEQEIIAQLCMQLKTQPEHLVKTVQRFREELDSAMEKRGK